jgi:mono/diheme cytochrome c family protein
MKSTSIVGIAALMGPMGLALTGVHAGSARAANAVPEEQLAHGHEVFESWCAPCHAPVTGDEKLAGTSTLQMVYKGAKPAALEQRTDLTAQLVAYYVRHGDNAMPWFRKTELSDEDVAAVGAYLARNTPKK